MWKHCGRTSGEREGGYKRKRERYERYDLVAAAIIFCIQRTNEDVNIHHEVGERVARMRKIAINGMTTMKRGVLTMCYVHPKGRKNHLNPLPKNRVKGKELCNVVGVVSIE